MITCYLQGGLGNQLFIIFTTFAYALQYKQPVLFYYSKILTNGCTVRYTYWDTFFKSIKGLTTVKPIMNGLIQIKELTENKYTKLNQVHESAILYGYFQSFKYFQNEYGEISRMLGIPNMRFKYGDWFSKNELDASCTISMHFRLDDYRKLNMVLPLSYYSNSLKYIVDNNPDHSIMTVLYFCEQENILEVNKNVELLSTKFPMCKFKYCNTITGVSTCEPAIIKTNCIVGQPEDEMIIMSICKYNIIANSTFSWWAAYIGDREDDNTHIVCYPDVENNDLYPDKWIRINL